MVWYCPFEIQQNVTQLTFRTLFLTKESTYDNAFGDQTGYKETYVPATFTETGVEIIPTFMINFSITLLSKKEWSIKSACLNNSKIIIILCYKLIFYNKKTQKCTQRGQTSPWCKPRAIKTWQVCHKCRWVCNTGIHFPEGLPQIIKCGG